MRLNDQRADQIVEGLQIANAHTTQMVDHRSYHELEDQAVIEGDVLTQFKTNLEVLTDLTSRLSFLNREIRYVLRVD
jgi:hypothetical protein